jgi:hypothetical protein
MIPLTTIYKYRIVSDRRVPHSLLFRDEAAGRDPIFRERVRSSLPRMAQPISGQTLVASPGIGRYSEFNFIRNRLGNDRLGQVRLGNIF